MSRSGTPRSWAEAYERFAYVLGDAETAREWVREALEARWGVLDPIDLPRHRRPIAFQKVCGVLMALEEDEYDLAFYVGVRAKVAGVFARFFDGVALAGPRWRLDPRENDRPAQTSADFE